MRIFDPKLLMVVYHINVNVPKKPALTGFSIHDRPCGISVIPRVEKLLGLIHFPRDSVQVRLASRLKRDWELLRTMTDTFMVCVDVNRQWFSRLGIRYSLYLKCPQEPRSHTPLSSAERGQLAIFRITNHGISRLRKGSQDRDHPYHINLRQHRRKREDMPFC